ncbi:hypothetical protein GGR52DRAFT_569059 [Hypoxylon sp. FL1284]|nr:hypothetical protein GGR52DRAFT_569059 [Hypoxylon sp. FL1284]
MARSLVLSAALGTVALLATAAILALEAVIAQGLSSPATFMVRVAAVVAAACHGAVLIMLIMFLADCLGRVGSFGRRKSSGIWFALVLLVSILALAASVVMVVMMGRADELPGTETIFHIPSTHFVIGSAIALVSAFAGQVVFIVIYFVFHRMPDTEQALSLHTNDDGAASTPKHVKSIPYTRTTAATTQTSLSPPKSKERSLAGYPTPPGSSSGHSVAETMSSIRSSLSHAVRSSPSKTELLPSRMRSARRPPSMDSIGYRSRSSVTDDGFDSWDTSSVDPQNRQIVVETGPPIRARFLETIPASPTTSRSPSPGCPLDLEPPKRCHRSRSYSPVARLRQERSSTPQSTSGELHIHPLFRSDSPAPPAATPGTIVVAAPNAGQTISEKNLTRMRSGTLPASPSNLSREGSYESFRKTPSPLPERLHADELDGERKMTPPIPDWILNSGSKTSLPLSGI